MINKTSNTIKIIWNDAVFVGLDNSSSRVIHSGVKYSEMSKSHPPSPIAPGSKINEIVHPTDEIDYSEITGWNKGSLITPTTGENRKKLVKEAKNQIGKQFKYLIPIEYEGTVNTYTFTFKVTEATIPKEPFLSY